MKVVVLKGVCWSWRSGRKRALNDLRVLQRQISPPKMRRATKQFKETELAPKEILFLFIHLETLTESRLRKK
jgi:hypothetical protein